MVPGQIPELRDLTRNRTQLMREVVQHKQRIQKVLEDANVKLASVVSDVLGQSGRRMLTAIIAGQTDARKLAALGSEQLSASRETLLFEIDAFSLQRLSAKVRVFIDMLVDRFG